MTTTAPHPSSDHKLPSLLEEPPAPVPAPVAAPRSPRASLAALRERLVRHKRVVTALAVLLAIGAGVGLYFALRPVPQPDFLEDDFDLGLDYALLTNDFNSLSLEERDQIFTEIISRLKSMPSGDSALMAAFAATLDAKARAQMMKNVSQYMIDTWDKYAVAYDDVAADERSEFLDQTFVEFTKKFEGLAGETSNKSDEQRLEEVRKQADRDRKNVESGKFNPPAQALGRVFEFMNFEVGGHASPQQRSRGQLMMRDMMRHFRGGDVNGEGKPATPARGDKPAEAPAGPR